MDELLNFVVEGLDSLLSRLDGLLMQIILSNTEILLGEVVSLLEQHLGIVHVHLRRSAQIGSLVCFVGFEVSKAHPAPVMSTPTVLFVAGHVHAPSLLRVACAALRALLGVQLQVKFHVVLVSVCIGLPLV